MLCVAHGTVGVNPFEGKFMIDYNTADDDTDFRDDDVIVDSG